MIGLRNSSLMLSVMCVLCSIFFEIEREKKLPPTVGIEPTATGLKVTRSTTELSRL